MECAYLEHQSMQEKVLVSTDHKSCERQKMGFLVSDKVCNSSRNHFWSSSSSFSSRLLKRIPIKVVKKQSNWSIGKFNQSIIKSNR